MTKEEKQKELAPEGTSPEEQEEEEIIEEEETEETDEETEEEPSEESTPPEDIDYHKKELDRLQRTASPARSEREKAIFTAKKLSERLQEMDIDPTEIFGAPKKPAKQSWEEKPEEVDVQGMETRIEERLEAKRLARSEDELRLMAWYMENKGLSARDAHVLANKGRVQTFLDEQKRAQVRVEQGSNASGRKKKQVKIPQLSQDQQQELARQGFVKQKDGSFEGKKVRMFYDPSSREWKTAKK